MPLTTVDVRAVRKALEEHSVKAEQLRRLL